MIVKVYLELIFQIKIIVGMYSWLTIYLKKFKNLKIN